MPTTTEAVDDNPNTPNVPEERTYDVDADGTVDVHNKEKPPSGDSIEVTVYDGEKKVGSFRVDTEPDPHGSHKVKKGQKVKVKIIPGKQKGKSYAEYTIDLPNVP